MRFLCGFTCMCVCWRIFGITPCCRIAVAIPWRSVCGQRSHVGSIRRGVCVWCMVQYSGGVYVQRCSVVYNDGKLYVD